jgi:hypothetical protein
MKATMIAFTAAVLLGLASTALATEPFGGTTYRPIVRDNDTRAYAQAPVRSLRHGAAQPIQPFAADERALFERMSRPE